jgi:Serine/threonine protein kinase
MELAPNGSFATLIRKSSLLRDEKVVRTYFHQLIEGLEYLHKTKVAHLDIKPENLLIGKNFELKIADFDSAYLENDSEKIRTRGTPIYRAPEIKNSSCENPYAADIHAAGVTLFLLLTSYYPYTESENIHGIDFEGYLRVENPQFWIAHSKLHNITVSQDFKDLFFSMVKEDAVERATIQEIKASAWYNGPIYTISALKHKWTNQY